LSDWRAFCRGAERISIDGESAVLVMTGDRRQRVEIRETPDTYEFMSVVVRPSVVASVPDVPLRAWRRNRAMQSVGFRVDRKGRLVGEAWVPKAGLSRDEFLLSIRRCAVECDLFEFHLTGEDSE
jgi:hypothetical protein